MTTLLALVNGPNMMKLLVCEYAFISLLFALNREWPRAAYWVGAAIITTSVIWMNK